jgi:hypothetical protein
MISRQWLLNLKKRALRLGVWFKSLNRIERVLFDLTIKVTRRVRSSILLQKLLSVAQKLEEAFESSFSQLVEKVGFPHACKLSTLAQKWGNPFAKDWIFDVSFAKFLAVMHYNDSRLSSGATS